MSKKAPYLKDKQAQLKEKSAQLKDRSVQFKDKSVQQIKEAPAYLREMANFRIKTIKQRSMSVRLLFFAEKSLAVIFFLAQLLLLVSCFVWLSRYAFFLFGSVTILGLIVIIYEVNRIDEPGYKIAWIMLIAIVPLFGSLLYIFLHLNIIKRKVAEKHAIIEAKTTPYLVQDAKVKRQLQLEVPEMSGYAAYMLNYGGYAVYRCADVNYYGQAIDMYNAILDDVRNARNFVFMEFFIVAPLSRMWIDLQEILIAKVQAGVEVRLLYDGFGSMKVAPGDFPAQLAKTGINCRCFSRVIPVLSNYQNNRDHRKMVIIDGTSVFTGGVNLSDEYINEKPRCGHWKDGGIRLGGKAVKCFTALFLQLWNLESANPAKENYEKFLQDAGEAAQTEITDFDDTASLKKVSASILAAAEFSGLDDDSLGFELQQAVAAEETEVIEEAGENKEVEEISPETASEYVPDEEPATAKKTREWENGFVIPFGDSPLSENNLGVSSYIEAVNKACKYVHIMTPYLVLGHDIIQAIRYAAQRDVEIVLLIPRICDKKTMQWLGRSYYPELLEVGVKIYEYVPGMVHTKAVVADDKMAIVGTINMDYRSFYLHYECAASFYNAELAAEIENDFSQTLLLSERITSRDYNSYSLLSRAAGKLLRLIAPLV